jgi:cell division protease FtsH
MIFLGREIHEQRNYSEKTAQDIDAEVQRLVNGAVDTARAIITKERKYLEVIANTLLQKETIEKDEFEKIFAESAT